MEKYSYNLSFYRLRMVLDEGQAEKLNAFSLIKVCKSQM